MRKNHRIFIILLMALVSAQIYAYDFEANGFYFNITDATNHEVEVTYKDTNYHSYSGVIDIPSTVKNEGKTYTVTAIGQRTFQNCENDLLQVTIPNTIKSIGDYAFFNSKSILSLTIGANLQSIGSYAFSYSYTNNTSTYFGRSTIHKVIWLCNTLPSGYSEINGKINYVSNSGLNLDNSIVYPFLSSRFEVDNVVYVPVSPSDRTCDVIDCNYNPSNRDIVIDSIVSNKGIQLKVLNINDYAIYFNYGISSLKISNAGHIGNWAFAGCANLSSATVSNNGNIGKYAFNSCKNLRSVTASNNGNIGYMAFDFCPNLSSVAALNNGVIEEYAFVECQALTNLIIGNKVFALCEGTFEGCSSLSKIKIPSNINIIGKNVFWGCNSLSDVTFEKFSKKPQYFEEWTSSNQEQNSVSSHEYFIDVNAGDILSFTLYSNGESDDFLTAELNGKIIASTSGQQVGSTYHTFDTDGSAVLKISYTKNSGQIGYQARGSIFEIALNNPKLTIDNFNANPLFADCPLDKVYIGRKLSYLTGENYSPFYGNSSLRSVKITDAETEIYDNEFYGCSNLQEFECGDGVEKIGNRAFSGCSKLASYSSGTNVKEIGEEAFSDCTAMTSFTSHAAEPPVCGNQALDDINKWECTLHVPAESVDDYKASPQWKEFFFIEEASVDEITTDGNNLSIKVIGTEMTIEGAEALPVAVYTIDGRLCATYNAYNGESISLGKGCYIVRAGNMTAKVMI